MDTMQLKEKIITGIKNTVEHIKEKKYWREVNSFCLFTDESLMSVALLFNTTSFYNEVKDDEYPLTYKYSPSEWFSETIGVGEDSFLYNCTAFSDVNRYLSSCINADDFDNYKNSIINTCIEAISESIDGNVFKKNSDVVFMFMISDYYEPEDILTWNEKLNSNAIRSEIKLWIENEL